MKMFLWTNSEVDALLHFKTNKEQFCFLDIGYAKVYPNKRQKNLYLTRPDGVEGLDQQWVLWFDGSIRGRSADLDYLLRESIPYILL
jgi:hypothetical protein